MQVIIKYHDNESFLPEEVIRQAKHNYGNQVSVSVRPESDTPMDYLYFALQRLITGELLSLIYDSGPTYQQDLKKLRAEIFYKVGEVLDDVIIDTEHKLHQED
jgi:hypothetical protein